MNETVKTVRHHSAASGVSGDSGVAMIMAIVGSALLLVLSLLVAQAVVATIRPSDTNEASFRALAAAEAGVAQYQARLSLAGNPEKVTSTGAGDPLDGWVPLQGAATGAAYFTYSVVDDPDIGPGRVKVRSSGLVGTTVRTVDAVLAKRSSLDYGYVSGSEMLPVDFPDLYGNQDPPSEALCGSAWYQPVGSQAHRDSTICKYYPITTNDRIIGNAHTNDVWYFDVSDGLDAFGDVFDSAVTSACPDGDIVAGENRACPLEHRWINIDYVPPKSGGGNKSTYIGLEIPEDWLVDGIPDWNPMYDSVLEFPDSMQGLKDSAAAGGCLFTGPTRIRFDTAADGTSLVYVTSPDTADGSVNDFCRLDSVTGQPKSYYQTNDDAVEDTTVILDYDALLAAGFNGIFFVQDAEEDPAVAPEETALPTCPESAGKPNGKSTSKDDNAYPFVVPSSGEGTSAFPPGVSPWRSNTVRGFPLESTNPDDPWAQTGGGEGEAMGTCSSGTVYLEGSYRGELTVGSDASIAITGQLWNADLRDTEGQRWCTVDGFAAPCVADDADALYGVPPLTSKNTLALIPGADETLATVYIYAPDSNGGEKQDWAADAYKNVNYLVVDAAMIIRNGCFGLKDNDISGTGNALELLKVVGSLAQSNRCPIRMKDDQANSRNGYKNFTIYYDERLSIGLAPPGVSDLFREPFRVVRIVEVNPSLVTDLPPTP